MTTLSTLIGSGHTSFGLGGVAAPRKASFMQRIGGVFRRRRAEGPSVPANASLSAKVPAVSNDLAPFESLKEVVDDSLNHDTPSDDSIGLQLRSDSIDDNGLSDSIDEQPQAGFGGGPSLPPTPPRRRLLWGGKRDTAIDEVRSGMTALASLLDGIQNNMERQSARQDELIACLSHLPMASAIQNESLQAIRDQISQGSANQSRLCVALERLGGLQETTGEALTSIGRRIDNMDARDATFAQSMEKVCDAMQTVSRASETGAIVLERVQHTLVTQQDGMTQTLDRHQTKFNALMAVAIAVSAAAMAVVAGVGYMVLTKL